MSQHPSSEINVTLHERLRKLILEFVDERSPCTENLLIEVFSSSSEFERFIEQSQFTGGVTKFVLHYLADLERAGLVKLEAGRVLVTEEGKLFIGRFKSAGASVGRPSPRMPPFRKVTNSVDPAAQELSKWEPVAAHAIEAALEGIEAALEAEEESSPVSVRPSARPPLHPRQPAPAAMAPSIAANAGVNQEKGWLAENIPRLMKVSVPEEVELRISKDQASLLVSQMRGRGDPHLRQVDVTAVMSLRLTAPQDAFIIHAHSAESQWVCIGRAQTNQRNFAYWRFTLIPTRRGSNILELTLSYKQVDASGLIADSALPDESIEIRVKANLKYASAKAAAWTFTLFAGAMLGANIDRITTWLSRLLP